MAVLWLTSTPKNICRPTNKGGIERIFAPTGRFFNYETFVFSDLFMFHPPGLRKRSKSKRFQTYFFCLHIKYDQTCPKLIWVIFFHSVVKTVIIVERFPHYCSTFKDYIDGHFQFMKQNNYKKRTLTQLGQSILTLIFFLKATSLIHN